MKTLKTIVLSILAIAVLAAVYLAGSSQSLGFLKAHEEDKSSEVITSIERREEIVLVSLGIQGVQEANEANRQILGHEVPGSARQSLIRYTFNAKLGIDGEKVGIAQTGDEQFTISVPEFIFIGNSDPHFDAAIESNGALSWMTPEIDQTAMVNDILDGSHKDGYIADNIDVLKDQTEFFYTSIVHSVDPEAALTFQFTDVDGQ